MRDTKDKHVVKFKALPAVCRHALPQFFLAAETGEYAVVRESCIGSRLAPYLTLDGEPSQFAD